MTTIAEYAVMKWGDPDWIEPITRAAIAAMTLQPQSTAQLIVAMGLGGLRNNAAASSLKSKLHALKKQGEGLEDCWRYSATKFTTYRDRETGEKMRQIEWMLPAFDQSE